MSAEDAPTASAAPATSAWPRVVVLGTAALWVALFASLMAQALADFAIMQRDLAIFEQVARSAAHGGLLRTSLETHGLVLQGGDSIAADVVRAHGGPSHFSSHFSPILWVLALPWWVSPGPMAVQWVHWLALAGTAWLVYRLADARLDHAPLAVGLALAYLLNPITLQAGLDPFREVSLAAPVLVWVALAMHRDDRRGLLVGVVLLLLIKEDLALWCALIGGARIASGQRRHGAVIVGVSIVGLVIASTVIDLARFGLPSDHLLRYAELGSTPGEIVVAVLFHPVDALSRAWNHAEPGYAFHLLGPWALLPLFSPWCLLALVPIGLNLMSALPEQHHALSYAHVLLAPLFAIATVDALVRLRDRWAARGAPARALRSVVIVIAVAMTASSVRIITSAWPSRARALEPRLAPPERDAARQFIDRLDPDASVMASACFLPALADRDRLFAPWAVPGFQPDAVLLDVSEPMIWPWRDPAARLEFLKGLTREGYESGRVGRVLMFRRIDGRR